MASRSAGCSTTQTNDRSREVSEQTAHASSLVLMTLKQMGQVVSPVLALTRASASARTSSSGRLKRWNARRCALLGPTPGNRPSSRIRVRRALGNLTLTASASPGAVATYCCVAGSEEAAHAAHAAESAHGGAHLLLLQLLGAALRFVDGCGNEVL